MKATSVVCGSVLALVAFAASAGAGPIIGTFNATGTYTYTALGAADFSLDFGPVAGGTGTASISSASGYFGALFPPNSLMDILDIATLPVAGFTTTPVGVGIFVGGPGSASFLSNFNAMPGLAFELNLIRASLFPICTGAEVVNQSCAGLAGSAFTLTRRTGGVDVDFRVSGKFTDGVDSGNGTGVFTTTFAGLTLADVANLLSTGGSGGIGASGFDIQATGITADYSATFTAVAVPEPSSMLLLGAGLAAAGIARKLRRTSSTGHAAPASFAGVRAGNFRRL